MNWEEFECEGCNLIFAIKQTLGDEIEDPACPRCGETNCETTAQDTAGRRVV